MGGPACLEDNPSICSTMSGTTPSPASFCYDEAGENCTTTYIGGYSWSHSFFVSVTNLTTIGLDTTIRLDDDLVNCSVTVNEAECNSCTVCDASDTSNSEGIFSADCTNINDGMEVGREIECESALTPFYPFALESGSADTMAPSEGDRAVDATEAPSAAYGKGMVPVAAFLVASLFF